MERITIPIGPRLGPWCGRSSTAQSAGESVSALIADRNIDTATVTANWRNSSPEMPGMKATGTNTDSNTSVIAMIGAVISCIARFVASAGESSGCSSMTHSTFSTTTMASSTTMPMASLTDSWDAELADQAIAIRSRNDTVQLSVD